MGISIFLAKALSIYFIIISIAFIINKKRLTSQILEMMNKPEIMLLSGFIALIVGIILVVAHNIWTKDWRIIVTLISWAVFSKGLFILFLPEPLKNISTKWIENNNFYYATFFSTFLIGFILLYFSILS